MIQPPIDNGTWQPASSSKPVPTGAFAAGQEGMNTFYVCRAPFENGVHSGKLFPTGMCNIPWGGREIALPESEVLVGGPYSWKAIATPLTEAPPGAVVSGYDVTGITLYACRATYKEGVHPGKVFKGQCNIAYGGTEVVLPMFDVLLVGAAPSPVDGRDASDAASDAPSGAAGDAPVDAVACAEATRDLSNVGPRDFKIAFNVSTTQTGWVALLNQRSACTFGEFWEIRQAANGTIVFEADDNSPSSYRSLASTIKINDGRPHNVVVARVSGTLTIRVDGAMAGHGPLPTPLGLMPPLRVGSSPCGGASTPATASLAGTTLSAVCINRG